VIRSSKLSINEANTGKLTHVDSLFCEFRSVVNQLIDKFWRLDRLGIFLLTKGNKVDSWLSARLQQAAGKQAIQIIKSVRKKDRDIRYRRYKKIYFKLKRQDRLHRFTEKRFSELKLSWKIKPEYKQDVIEFDERFVDIQFDSNSFDVWIRLTSLGNKLSLKLPAKRNKHFNKFYGVGELKKSVRLRKDGLNYFVDVFFGVPEPEKCKSQKSVGVDIGLNKLLSTSDGKFFGTEFKDLLNKLERKQYASKSYLRTVAQVKNYIGESVNKMNLSEFGVVVLEDIKNISKNTVGRLNGTMRKYLSRWNYAYIRKLFVNKCEVGGSELIFVDPAYTSQTCPVCKTVDKASRRGELFTCSCGYRNDADTNGAINILLRGLGQEFIVPGLTQNVFILKT